VVSQQATQTGVTKKAIAARGVGYDAEVILAAKIIYPWRGSIRPGNDKLPGFVIEVTITLAFRHS
jgi:hypothetical protein